MAGDTNTVLVAATDPDVATRVRSWLAGNYRVETTTDGDEALAHLEDVDAVLVDRELRTASGTVVAAEIEHRIAAQTVAVLRDDGLGGDHRLATDESLDKPLEEDDLRETVDRLVRRGRYDDLIAECAALAARRGAIETRDDRGSDEEYETVRRQLDEVFTELDELVQSFDGDDFRAAFATCELGTTAQPQCASEQS